MTKIKKAIIFLCFCVTIMCFFSQTVMAMQSESNLNDDNKQAEQFLKKMLKAVEMRDQKTINDNFWSEEPSSFEEYFDLWGGRTLVSYTLEWKEKEIISSDIEGMCYTYKVYTEDDEFLVEFTLVEHDGQLKANWFAILILLKSIYSLESWREFNVFQWLILLLAVLEVAFTIHTATLCAREKHRFWGLWMAAILILYGGIAFTTAGNYAITFYASPLKLPNVFSYPGLPMRMELSLPIGAIAYWIKYRKSNACNRDEMPNQTVENCDDAE